MFHTIGTDEQFSVMMVSYDSEGELVDATIQNVIPAVATVESVELSAGKTNDIRIYVWSA